MAPAKKAEVKCVCRLFSLQSLFHLESIFFAKNKEFRTLTATVLMKGFFTSESFRKVMLLFLSFRHRPPLPFYLSVLDCTSSSCKTEQAVQTVQCLALMWNVFGHVQWIRLKDLGDSDAQGSRDCNYCDLQLCQHTPSVKWLITQLLFQLVK